MGDGVSDLPSLARRPAGRLRARGNNLQQQEERRMNSSHGSFEDKWVDFVFAECGARGRAVSRDAFDHGRTAAATIRRAEVRASYIWLFAGALIALWMR